ncbi:hypothetical protein BS47DRAFT_781544 [Hydnum rufescens UP504]|uniref:Uncharacterized protein n=1 Tax=Hydnum rufescens UP504 TaxID=1448309 RepID=A0A9P6B0Q5_9AGAM|nr:hypothetical protein BS47DRAFT_781544 [Hydnum rufescens UP504]
MSFSTSEHHRYTRISQLIISTSKQWQPVSCVLSESSAPDTVCLAIQPEALIKYREDPLNRGILVSAGPPITPCIRMNHNSISGAGEAGEMRRRGNCRDLRCRLRVSQKRRVSRQFPISCYAPLIL